MNFKAVLDPVKALAVLVAMLALENVNGLAVLGGATWLYVGLAGYSVHAANVVAGGLLLAIGAYPYLTRKRKP